MSAEVQRKLQAKYDPRVERLAVEWIQALTGDSCASGFGPSLKNGQTLCRLVNAIRPNSVSKIETSSLAFKQMENVSRFLQSCRAFGVHECDVFETVDLFEEKVRTTRQDLLHGLVAFYFFKSSVGC